MVVIGMDRIAPADDALGEGCVVVHHNFLWKPDMQPGQVRILPSLYAVDESIDDWHQWAAVHVAHAANSELDQSGPVVTSGSPDKGRLLGAPTLYLNASTCGQVVDTTQDPWHLTDLAEAQEDSGVTGREEVCGAPRSPATGP